MAFNVFLFFAFISCACGFSGPTTGPRFVGTIKNACVANSANSPTSEQTDDACYGCFIKFSQQTQSPDALSLLTRCRQTYLTAEPYSECAATNGTENTNVYCSFEKCIERLSSTDLVNQCLTEAREISDTVNATLIINVVKCILAKHRCLPDSSYTPYPNAPPRSNALFVDSENLVRVVYNVYFDQGTSPCTYGPNGEYIYTPNPTQPGWPSAQCSAEVTTTTVPDTYTFSTSSPDTIEAK